MLRISIEAKIGDPEIGPQQIPRFDHGIGVDYTLRALTLDADGGMKPCPQTQTGQLFAVPPSHIVSCRHTRSDDLVRECFGDECVRSAHDARIDFQFQRGTSFKPAN